MCLRQLDKVLEQHIVALECDKSVGSVHVSVGEACPQSPASDTRAQGDSMAECGGVGLSPGPGAVWGCRQGASSSLRSLLCRIKGGLAPVVQRTLGSVRGQLTSGCRAAWGLMCGDPWALQGP